MARYFMELAYRGTAYHGWQIQPNGNSVQQELEHALSTILKVKTPIVGAGRTDAGVHASYMVAHFNTEQIIDDEKQLAQHLSRFLPRDLVVFSVTQVHDDCHSRFSATARRYEYHLTNQKNPFYNELVHRVSYLPDFEAMNLAATHLLGTKDFTSFSKLHSDNKTDICTITKAYWEERGNRWIFVVEADRFLRNMVRAIVGTLLDVGRGKISIDQFNQIIEAKNRKLAGSSAPAQGLYLVDVKYPIELFKRIELGDLHFF
jgi:tRNA pseudouridine38-40 synthase